MVSDFAKVSAAFIAVVIARIFTEFAPYGELSGSYLRYLESFTFFAMIFLALVLGISRLGNEKPLKAAGFVMKFFWLVALAPLADNLVFGMQSPYYYGTESSFLYNFFTSYFFHPGAGPAQIIAAFIVTAASAACIFRRTRSIGRPALFFMLMYAFSAFVSTSPARFAFVANVVSSPEIFTNISFFSYFSLALALWIFGCRKSWIIFRDMRPSRAFYFAVLALLPFFIYDGRAIFAVNAAVAVFLLWNAAAAVNDITDLRIDRITAKKRILVSKRANENDVLHFAYITMAFAFLLASIAGTLPLLIALVAAFVSLSYSLPPLRLRRFLLSNFIIGLSASLAFLFGFFHAASAIGSNAVIFALLCFAVTGLAAFTIDLKDYRGDKKAKVKTLFTKHGKSRGKKLAMIILFLAFLLPSAFLPPEHLPFFIILAAAAAFIYHRKENVVFVVFMTLANLLYTFVFFFHVI